MKKNIFSLLVMLFAAAFCAANAQIKARETDFYTSLSDNEKMFFENLQSCSPAILWKTNEKIYGVTKNGLCHYSYKERVQGTVRENHCILPMQVAIAYATTALDVADFIKLDAGLANERLQQNNEIIKIMLDYCKL